MSTVEPLELRHKHAILLIRGETPANILRRRILQEGTTQDGKVLRVCRLHAPTLLWPASPRPPAAILAAPYHIKPPDVSVRN